MAEEVKKTVKAAEAQKKTENAKTGKAAESSAVSQQALQAKLDQSSATSQVAPRRQPAVAAAARGSPLRNGVARVTASREEIMSAESVFRHPLISEKAIGLIEKENRITFIVKKEATKAEVKKAFESLYGAKADKINIIRDMKGRKKAIVKVNKAYKADDIATKLGII